ncbi:MULTISPECIES: permease prefix domain 1-containing protein [unclassified Micromonospora]|uniref:permease prefix domain 1-containing protein n=1 Tax=unclassified Micromonospora TaxID=2617518 RepID=UPI002FF2F740
MRGCDEVRVADRLRELDDRLRGPARLKAELMVELRHALDDAAEAYREGGLSAAEAERRAVAEFGAPAQLAPAYQAELAAAALRGLSVRAFAVALVLLVAGDLTWKGSSWSGGPPPPAGYLLLSASVNWVWLGVAGFALAALALGAGAARRGRADVPVAGRLVGLGLTGALALGAAVGVALFAWSVQLWDAALTWPPMIIGALLVGAGYCSLARAARCWLRAAR